MKFIKYVKEIFKKDNDLAVDSKLMTITVVLAGLCSFQDLKGLTWFLPPFAALNAVWSYYLWRKYGNYNYSLIHMFVWIALTIFCTIILFK